MRQVVSTRAMTMQTASGRQVRTVDMREAAEIIGCVIEDISYWLDQEWLEHVECSCCTAVFALLDEVLDIANLAALYPTVNFDTLVFDRFREMRAMVETQVQQEVRAPSQKLLAEQSQSVVPQTLRTHRQKHSIQQTVSPQIVEQDLPRGRRREMETHTCSLEGSIPLDGVPQKKRHWWQRES